MIVSRVDEDAVLAARDANPRLTIAESALILARAKARDVAGLAEPGALILGCDSILEIDGEAFGKPGDAANGAGAMAGDARQRRACSTPATGSSTRAGPPLRGAGDLGETRVHASCGSRDLTDEEIDAYVATGEPLSVAGAFTVDGLGGPFVEAIEGDYHNVVGVSLPLLRRLCADSASRIPELWSAAADLLSVRHNLRRRSLARRRIVVEFPQGGLGTLSPTPKLLFAVPRDWSAGTEAR